MPAEPRRGRAARAPGSFAAGGVPPGGMDGYREHRLLTYAYAALPPPPNLPPPGGGAGLPPPAGGGLGRGAVTVPAEPRRGRAVRALGSFAAGGVPPGGMDGYREHRLLTYAYAALTPPPNLPPPGGGAGLPPPSGGRAGEGGRHRARGAAPRAGRPRSQAMFIAALCGAAAWAAEVTIARRVLPPSQPPPAGGRRRVPAPSGGGSGRGRNPCLEAGRRRGGVSPPLRRRSRRLPPGGSRGAPLLT